jgi:hypothetical protein
MEILSSEGGFKVLGGLWEVPDAATNLLIESIERHGGKVQLAWLKPVYQLLRLSDLALSRAGLSRWDIKASEPKSAIPAISDTDISSWKNHVTFTTRDLIENGIDINDLEVFISSNAPLNGNKNENDETLTFFSKPLMRVGRNLILAVPTAVTYAIRKTIVDLASAVRQLSGLNNALMNSVVRHTERAIRASSRHKVVPISLPQSVTVHSGPFKSLVFRVGQLRILHLLVIQDPLKDFARACLDSPSQLSDDEETALDRHIASVRKHVESLGEFDTGYTISISGHLGQGTALSAPRSRTKWTYESTRLDSLEYIMRASDGPLDKLLLLLSQLKSLQTASVHLPNYNGLLNLYSFWIGNGHTIRISEMAHDQSGLLQIATDHILEYRLSKRQALDIHCELNTDGKSVITIRTNSESVYDSVKEVAAYLDISNLTQERESFCIRFGETAVWITLRTRTTDAHHHRMMHELWEGLQILLSRTLSSHRSLFYFGVRAVEIILDFANVIPSEQALQVSESIGILALEPSAASVVSLRANPEFLASFGGIGNAGERLLLSHVISALHALSKNTNSSVTSPDNIALEILGGEDAKILHALTAVSPLRHLLSADSRSVFRLPVEYMDATIRSAFTWMPSASEPVVLDRDSSCQTLNKAVAHLLEQISVKLSRFDKRSLVAYLLHSHETLLRDQQRWAMTARAVLALHGAKDGTAAAHERDQERAQAKLTLRVLAEAAVCECATSAGLLPDGTAVDELFGLMWALVQIGRDSEAIYHGLSSEGITVHPSGAYSFTADILNEIGGKYTVASFRSNYEAAAGDYERWVTSETSEKSSTAPDDFESKEFQLAFQAEYGFSYDQFLEICATLLDEALEQKMVLVELSRSELIALCMTRGVPEADVNCFLTAFVLTPRPTWAPQRPFAEPRDVQPWRFERRLSIMLRPLIECPNGTDSCFVYGVTTFEQSIKYVLESTEQGKFDKDVFRSTEMRSYIGRRVDALGAEFTKRVALTLQELGWKTQTEVKMSALGAGKKPNLGDIDVLAWTEEGYILIVECKRLKNARTISEIALACDRFRGNTGDHLFKHLRRVEWVTKNLDKLAQFTKLDPSVLSVRGPLVTSANVPFRYLRDLAIEPDNIWSYAQLTTNATLRG